MRHHLCETLLVLRRIALQSQPSSFLAHEPTYKSTSFRCTDFVPPHGGIAAVEGGLWSPNRFAGLGLVGEERRRVAYARVSCVAGRSSMCLVEIEGCTEGRGGVRGEQRWAKVDADRRAGLSSCGWVEDRLKPKLALTTQPPTLSAAHTCIRTWRLLLRDAAKWPPCVFALPAIACALEHVGLYHAYT